MSINQTLGMLRVRPEQIEQDASATVRLIKTHVPHFEPKIEPDYQYECWTIKLPCPPSAEYRFNLHGLLLGERQISADLVGPGATRSPKSFWYSPMELADFSRDASKLESIFHERVEALLKHPTRIVENRGVLLLSYNGEYQSEAGWLTLGGVTYLGLGLGIPFVGKRHVYTSPPIDVGE